MKVVDEVKAICARPAKFADTAYRICQLLRERVPHYNWVGVYMVRNGFLWLDGWDGPTATSHTKIPVGEGICGLAARTRETVIVDDVSKDSRYLACFLNTRSEIVVPIFLGADVIGEIDIDSDELAAFNQLDDLFLRFCAEQLALAFANQPKRLMP